MTKNEISDFIYENPGCTTKDIATTSSRRMWHSVQKTLLLFWKEVRIERTRVVANAASRWWPPGGAPVFYFLQEGKETPQKHPTGFASRGERLYSTEAEANIQNNRRMATSQRAARLRKIANKARALSKELVALAKEYDQALKDD